MKSRGMNCRLYVTSVPANDRTLADIAQKQDDANRQRCSGMYSRKSWGGSVDPFILTKFLKDTEEEEGDPLVSIVIFEWQDEPLIGGYKEGSDPVRWR